ncbi:hypothetical protein ANANG_G00318850 [Anguilla anguilla]|uniref:Ig-like domain-containing protein n=1 Tax=Anguilla anguilla TaxID=7936 RepID=A0A9D3LHP7_ANGAN|nr:hypothetical protein ANANG_G00318850 [Anguilla anguilla]
MMMSNILLLVVLGLFAQESMADIVLTQSPSAQSVQQGDTVSISCTVSQSVYGGSYSQLVPAETWSGSKTFDLLCHNSPVWDS